MKVIIFDFDGTIADSFEVVLKISNRLAAEFGYPKAQPEDISRLKNLSSREVIRQSKVSPFKLPLLLRRLRCELNQEIHRLKPIPGMKEALLMLKQQGNRLGIVTSNSCENVAAFLEVQELSDVFDFIGSGLALFGKGRIIQRILKQHQLNPADVIYVGDETRDIEAARKIGIPVVAVSWGFNSRQALAAENPDFLIDHPEELLQVVEYV
ncbi:haloacid dehalogenase superfamily enzyme, subfamily IA [Leptolyngbyaceae cyanobacterium JSC-12]|nr:haloacid dehalogenase superfamily enzyme, subfamily IA [Leptolyngbyaceae cyanobacterium JSC-12]